MTSQVKLIAEPWDLGEGGYQVGNFPPVWSEWNGKYLDCVRDLWPGRDEILGEFAVRFTGSPDLYENTSRLPFASINFITAHDGFTLRDLVSYDEKHNEDNGEGNRDGADDNGSWNCGVEGPTNDSAVLALRARQQCNFLTTLLLSQGVSMLLGGDEIGRSQQGNNNAYCRDNEIFWYDWENADQELLVFTRKLIAFRHSHPVLRRRRWFQGRAIHGAEITIIAWFTHEGEPLAEEDWGEAYAKSLGVYLNGKAIPNPNSRNEPVIDDSFYVIFNAHYEPLTFRLPSGDWGENWTKEFDTAAGWAEDEESCPAGSMLGINARTLSVLRQI